MSNRQTCDKQLSDLTITKLLIEYFMQTVISIYQLLQGIKLMNLTLTIDQGDEDKYAELRSK